MIVKADYRVNVGKIVHIVALHDRGGDIVFAKEWGACWWVSSPTRMKWTVKGKVYRRKAGPVPDAKLQPIRGNPEQRRTRRAKEIAA